MHKLPNEIIDKILLKLNDIHVTIAFKNDYVSKKLCIINNYNIDDMSKNGHLDVIKFLHNIGAKCTINAIINASKCGYLEVVKFLHSIGAETVSIAMFYASNNGHLNVVKFLHSIDTECPSVALYNAYWNCHFDIVEFLCNNELKNSCNEDSRVLNNEKNLYKITLGKNLVKN